MGHTSEFLFGIYWWTWKTNNYLKNCWSGPIKNKTILIFTTVYFFKKDKENTCRYHYENLDDMIYSFWDIEQNIIKLVILGHFLPLYTPKSPKIKILKNLKTCWRYHYFTHVYQKPQYMMYSSWDAEWEKQNFLSFWAISCPFTHPLPLPSHLPNDPKRQNFGKKWEKYLEIISFYSFMCTINEDHLYDIWLLKYKVQLTEIFVILGGIFCPFSPLATWKI